MVGEDRRKREREGERNRGRERERKIAHHSSRLPTANGQGKLCEEVGFEEKSKNMLGLCVSFPKGSYLITLG